MPSIFDQFPSQAPVDVAGTPFQDQPSAVSKLLFGKPEGPDVRDPQKMAPARYIVAGGKTHDPAQDAAWDDATASPNAKRVREIMGSEPMKRLMDLANFLGPGPKMPVRAMAPEGPKGIRAYHGSPHDFDRFDLSRIGSGEGAQAYGHGLYFAEGENVAKYYRDALSKKPAVDGKPLLDQNYNVTTSTGHPYLDKTLREAFGDIDLARDTLMANIKSEPWTGGTGDFWKKASDRRVAESKTALDALDEMQKSGRLGHVSSGRMYEVNIKADPDQFLDYDGPLDPKVQEILNPITGKLAAHEGVGRALEYAKKYMRMAGDDRIPEQLLREAGIPGIKYKDQGSRGAEGGTSNYVVFDDQLIDIIKKYGLAGLLAGGGALSQGGGGDGDAY
jgi:hypothetical protein